jgi:hypothetical protein
VSEAHADSHSEPPRPDDISQSAPPSPTANLIAWAIWRRISGGTDSAEGSRFVERMLTVVATCRQQGREVLADLASCFEAARRGQAIPSLVPATPPKIKVA